MPKPASDLERYLAGEFAEGQDALPLVVVLAATLLLALAPVLAWMLLGH
ncbi:MAG TPA: hypothetical protein VLF42_01670 [Burkholderiales bacterium]|nr:hypothetical protein [Burkholderiales bacterium]